MNKLKNIQKILFEIKTTLLNNENIRKILYYDQPNALSLPAPNISEVEEYIGFFPITDMGIANYTKSTIMSIHCMTIEPDSEEEGSIYAGFVITIVTTKNLWTLDNNKIRLLELATLISSELEGKKLSLPVSLEILKMDDVIFDDSRVGYLIKIFGEDLQKTVAF